MRLRSGDMMGCLHNGGRNRHGRQAGRRRRWRSRGTLDLCRRGVHICLQLESGDMMGCLHNGGRDRHGRQAGRHGRVALDTGRHGRVALDMCGRGVHMQLGSGDVCAIIIMGYLRRGSRDRHRRHGRQRLRGGVALNLCGRGRVGKVCAMARCCECWGGGRHTGEQTADKVWYMYKNITLTSSSHVPHGHARACRLRAQSGSPRDRNWHRGWRVRPWKMCSHLMNCGHGPA